MPINRLKSNGSWGNIGLLYRLKNNGAWGRIQSVYRLKSNGTWNLVYGLVSNIPVVTSAPTLTTGGGSSTDFTHQDTITLTRGTWTKTGSTYDPVSYNLQIQSGPSTAGPWTDVATGTGTTVSYAISIAETRSPSQYFRGRVVVTNSAGQSIPFTTTPVRARINLSVTKPVASTSPNIITVSWITTPTNSSQNIASQTLAIIANQQYTFNGNTYNVGDVVYSTSVSPGTQTNFNISLAGTNITAPISYRARVTVIANDSAATTVVSQLSDAFTTNALTPPTPTDVTWTLIGGVKTWSIFFTGGSGPFYQTIYAFNAFEQTTTGFEASGSSSPITYTGLQNPTDNVSLYWFVRSSNALNSNTSNDISLWSAASIEYRPRVPFNVSVSVAPTSGTAGVTTYTATASASGTPTPTISYQWQFFDSEISQTWQNLGTGSTSSTYTPASNYVSLYGGNLRCTVTATNLMGSTSAISNQVTVSVATTTTTSTAAPTTTTTTTAAPSYVLTVNCNGGTGCPASGTHNGTYVIPSTNPTRSGFTFNGYDATCTGVSIGRFTAGQSVPCDGTIVLTASWTAINVAPFNVSVTVAPTSGTAGSTLFTATASASGTPTPTIAYQWQFFDSEISNSWQNLTGATSQTYTPPSNYRTSFGPSLRCRVTATNVAGSASANSNEVTVNAPATTTTTTTAAPTTTTTTAAPTTTTTTTAAPTTTTTTTAATTTTTTAAPAGRTCTSFDISLAKCRSGGCDNSGCASGASCSPAQDLSGAGC